MILNWKKTVLKDTTIKELFLEEVTVYKLTKVDFSMSDESCFIGEVIPGAELDDMVECLDGVYLVRGGWHIGTKEKRLSTISGAAVCVIQNDKVKVLGTAGGGNDWALRLRSIAADALQQQPDLFAKFSTEELEKELIARRGNRREKAKKVIVAKQVSLGE